MGSYTFKWEHPAEEVYVTGTFDNWTKSIKLEKHNGVFQKTVDLKDSSEKIYYKFVVDNNWTTNESSPKEADKEGNINNFLSSKDLQTPLISNIGTGATTANMAGNQPLEKDLNKSVGINPLPASEGTGNPVQLKPGEKVPQNLVAGDINKHVKLDKESYENSDSLPGGAPGTAAISNIGPGATTAALAGQVPLEPKAAANKTPDATSGDDDKKKKKKNKKKNKKKKNAAAAAAADSKDDEADDDDKEDAEEEKSSGAGTAAAIGAGATAAGGAAVAAAIAASNAVGEKTAPYVEQAAPHVESAKTAATKAANDNLPPSVKDKLPSAAQEALASNNEKPAADVPAEVQASQKAAGVSPEASANQVAVDEKKAVEAELVKDVKKEPASDEIKAQQSTAVPAAAVPAATVPAVVPAAAPGAAALPLTDKTSDSKPVETKGTAAQPADAKAAAPAAALPLTTSDPAAHQSNASKPVESKPAPALATETPSAKPVESKPVESKPVESKPVESKPVESKPVEPKPVESKPVEPKPVESKPVEPKPVESKPVESKPVESKPVESKVAESKPVETAESKAAKKAAESKPAAAETKKSDTPANGSSSKPAQSSSAVDNAVNTAGTELKKKKGGLSSILSKIKSKLSGKN